MPETHAKETIADDIAILQRLAKHMRQRRYETGALSLNKVKLHFDVDPDLPEDQANPTIRGIGVYEGKDANKLIEEFMLLANTRVAEKLYSTFPENSLLRCHAPPLEERMDALVELGQTLGVHLDSKTAGSLHQSFQAIQDPIIKEVLFSVSLAGHPC